MELGFSGRHIVHAFCWGHMLEAPSGHRTYPFIHIWRDRGTTFRAALQVTVRKGDIRKVVRRRTFLLTLAKKPIIISSFHRGRGARVCGAGFLSYA
jgi:hypothetical protein